MFFYLSKILWFFADPGNAFLMALIVGLILARTRIAWMGRCLAGLAIVGALILTFVPVGGWMVAALEDRFPMPETLPEKVDGIVVLGGVINPANTKARNTLVINGAIERLTETASLSARYPDARIVFTGGSGDPRQQQAKEADYVSALFAQLGGDANRLILERDSRNTTENAEMTFNLVRPEARENWLLVTSAFHMPRAVGVFRRIGWEVIPYPVDYRFPPSADLRSPLSFTAGLGQFHAGFHEWVGLFSYWMAGKTGELLPKPRGEENS